MSNHPTDAMARRGAVVLMAQPCPGPVPMSIIARRVYLAMERQREIDDRAMRSEALRARQEANHPWPVVPS